MTVESDIMKKLKSVQEDINKAKKIENYGDIEDVKIFGTDGRTGLKIKGSSNIILLFDATGSMAPLWSSTKKIMNELIKRITNVGVVKIKCVAYRDYCDGPKIFESSNWHSDARPLVEFIERIKCDGGGDDPEAVEDALNLAYKEKENVTRVILIGDAPPHSNREAVRQATRLAEKKIPVYAFRVGGSYSAKESFNEIAEASKGSYGDLEDYRDLLDMIGVTILHDVGGLPEVEKYLRRYGASEHVKEFSKSLPSYNK